MKTITIFCFFLFFCTIDSLGQEAIVSSPDNKLVVQLFVKESKPFYSIHYEKKQY